MRKTTLLIAAFASALLLSVYLAFTQSQVQVGFATLLPDTGSSRPTGTALFTYTTADGVILWQAGVAAVEPIQSGRIFVDRTAGTRSAIALANPSDQIVNANFILRDASGNQRGSAPQIFNPHQHRALFVDQLISSIPDDVNIGSLSFETSSPGQRLAAVTLRESQTTKTEYIYATLPVIDLNGSTSRQNLTFPHVALGGGYTTQIILISRSTGPVGGKVRFIKSDGNPFQLQSGAEVPYSLPGNGAFRLELAGGGDVQVGYAVVTLESGDAIPSGTLIFQYRQGTRLVTEAGVGAISPTTRSRIFIDRAGSETGIAIANTGNPATSVVLELMDRQGASLATASVDLPAGGHVAKLAYELFPDMPQGFSGECEIRAQVPVVPITLKLTTNKRNDFLLTTLPVADLTQAPPQGIVVFPQIAFGAEYSTRLILISADPQKNVTGSLRLYQSSGAPLNVPLAGQTGDQFAYQVSAGAIRQLRPGNTATVRDIILDSANPDSSEIAVNEGNSINLVPVVIDSDQNVRDDFQFGFNGYNSQIASVDTQGRIQGKQAGFTSLAVSTGNVVKAATVVVARINSGAAGGYEITGVVQDLARRVYLANSSDQVILQMQSLAAAPQVYAGVSKSPGLKDDLRLQSLFKNPAFLAIDQSRGAIFTSDPGNNVIRRISAGADGRVGTLSTDQTLNNPQGVALDGRGYLWVADSGSHTIRRINLSNNKVSTIAGLGGSSGLADGTGSGARFNAPTGIAVETETLVQQLVREKNGTPPPPISVLVADTGNNLIRRVTEAGKVTTIGSGTSDPGGFQSAPVAGSGKLFNAPAGVATDQLGNIYVTEPGGSKIKILLAATGQVVQAAQSGTFQSPRGVVIAQSGKVMVGAKDRSGQEITYGQPVVSNITPQTILAKGGARVTISGRNFAPETVVIVAGTKMNSLLVSNTETLSFIAPELRSGRTIVSVQNRGGLAQTSLAIQPPSLAELPQGYITTIAGGATFEGEGAAATAGSVNLPFAVNLGSTGNLYIADTFNHRVRKVDLLTGIMTSVAGTGVLGISEDNALATATDLANPNEVSLDPSGNILIADTGGCRVRRVDAKSGIITTVAGKYLGHGFSGDGGPATSALLESPKGVFADSSGNLYIADTYNNRIRKVDAGTGIIATIAGNGARSYGGDNGPATSASLSRPEHVVADASGNVFVADTENHRIRRIDATTKIITTYAGTSQGAFSGDGGPAQQANLKSPSQLCFDVSGNLYIADAGNAKIRRIDTNGVITSVAGSGNKDYSGDGGPATSAGMASPEGVAVDGSGQIFIADSGNYRIRLVDSGGIITTLAGNGHTSYLGDNGPAWAASLRDPQAIAFDSSGNLYIADTSNLRIRKVDAKTGTITTVAGTDLLGYAGDNVPATSAGLGFPRGVALDAAGNVYVADTLSDPYSGRVRKVDASTGILTTFAGNGKQQSPVDNVPATQSAVVYPFGVGFDTSGNLLIAETDAETDNHRVRKVNGQTGIITTIAGTGPAGFGGDFGPAINAKLDHPVSVSSDRFGNIFIADNGNNRVRWIDNTGAIATVAGGNPIGIYCCDGFWSPLASIPGPIGLVSDNSGNLYIAGIFSRVLRVDATTLNLTTVAGTGDLGFGGDGGPATQATFLVTAGLAFDPSGNLYVTDQFNGRIRVIKGPIK